jgi:arylformamidase
MTKDNNWIYLSYPLSTDLANYGNGNRISIGQSKSIIKGDSSNNTEFCMSSHLGTHIDFPKHFSKNGRSIDDYSPKFFISKNISVLYLENLDNIDDYLIKPEHIANLLKSCIRDTEILILKTGFSYKRNKDEYWKFGYGLGLGTAKLIRQTLPNIKAIGFDLISLTSYQQREIGRLSHKEYLIENEILIIEDLDLSKITSTHIINQLIVSPIIIRGAEGAPVTVFANISK